MPDGTVVVNQNGLILSTGALVTPPRIVEANRPYRLTRTLPPRAVDLSQPRLLSRHKPVGWDSTFDVRVADINRYYQDLLGACAAASSSMQAEVAAVIGGRGVGEPRGTHFGWKYHRARQLDNIQGDNGSYVSTNLDLERAGCPALDSTPYVVNADYDYPDSMDEDHSEDYILGNRPFYFDRKDPEQFIREVWMALDANEPVVFSSYWPNQWFSPVGGKLATGMFPRMASGGHAYGIWGIIPGWFLKTGTWSRGWSPDGPDFGWDLRPGEAAVPWDAVYNEMIWEGQALSFEPIEPVPEPEPVPDPEDETFDWRGFISQLLDSHEHLRIEEINAARAYAKHLARVQDAGADRLDAFLRERMMAQSPQRMR